MGLPVRSPKNVVCRPTVSERDEPFADAGASGGMSESSHTRSVLYEPPP